MSSPNRWKAQFLPPCQEFVVAYATLFGLVFESEAKPSKSREFVAEPVPVLTEFYPVVAPKMLMVAEPRKKEEYH